VQGVARQRVIATPGAWSRCSPARVTPCSTGCCARRARRPWSKAPVRWRSPRRCPVGDTWMLHALWSELGFAEAFGRLLRRRRQSEASSAPAGSSHGRLPPRIRRRALLAGRGWPSSMVWAISHLTTVQTRCRRRESQRVWSAKLKETRDETRSGANRHQLQAAGLGNG
jgi:hypothetical protein